MWDDLFGGHGGWQMESLGVSKSSGLDKTQLAFPFGKGRWNQTCPDGSASPVDLSDLQDVKATDGQSSLQKSLNLNISSLDTSHYISICTILCTLSCFAAVRNLAPPIPWCSKSQSQCHSLDWHLDDVSILQQDNSLCSRLSLLQDPCFERRLCAL